MDEDKAYESGALESLSVYFLDAAMRWELKDGVARSSLSRGKR